MTRRVPTRRRSAIAVLAIAAVAVLAPAPAAATRTSDGPTPLPTYRWVAPPAFFASGNQAPQPVHTSIALGARGSEAASVTTPDGQLTLSLAEGAVPPRAGARRIDVSAVPLDPADLAGLPGSMRPNGNAYALRLTYEPGGEPVRELTTPGTLVLQIPEIGRSLFASSTGRRWKSLEAVALPPRNLSLSAPFTAPGYFVGGTRLPELVPPDDGSSSDAGWWWAAGIGVVVLGLGGVGIVVLRARRRRTSPLQ